MSEALRLARGEPGLAYEALPGTVSQQGELADALVLLEVGENLLGDLLELIRRDERLQLRKRLRQLRFVLDAQRIGAPVQLVDLRCRQWQRRARLDGAGDPGVGLRLGGDLAGGLDRRKLRLQED